MKLIDYKNQILAELDKRAFKTQESKKKQAHIAIIYLAVVYLQQVFTVNKIVIAKDEDRIIYEYKMLRLKQSFFRKFWNEVQKISEASGLDYWKAKKYFINHIVQLCKDEIDDLCLDGSSNHGTPIGNAVSIIQQHFNELSVFNFVHIDPILKQTLLSFQSTIEQAKLNQATDQWRTYTKYCGHDNVLKKAKLL